MNAVVESPFTETLRYWRRRRGLSQLELSAESGISQRHISFLESGRASPSREMVLRLGLVLEVPLRQRNLMLLSAGFAPLDRERALGDPELRPVMQALEFTLAQHAPNPAIVVDRLWNLRLANEPAGRLVHWLLGAPEARVPALADSANLLLQMLHPAGMRPWIANWEQVAADLLHTIHREAMVEGPDGAARALLRELLTLDGLPAEWRAPNLDARPGPFLPLRLVKDGVALNFFTAITTLGTPHDVTLHELRLETFFPTDDATAAWLRQGTTPEHRP